MNRKMMGELIGGLLVIIAIILGVVQHFGMYQFYSEDYKWYFWSFVGIIGLIGIILAAWSYSKK